MLEELKQQVYEANMELPRRRLVTYTWGNVSGIDREKGLFVIKPSGVEYDELTPDMLVVMDLNGKVKVEGELNPSSDTKTHLELYKAFPRWAASCIPTPLRGGLRPGAAGSPAFGTTHADYFYGPVPCTRELTPEEIDEDYEKNTGKVIVETSHRRGIDPVHVPGVLCASHGPFTWGKDAAAGRLPRRCVGGGGQDGHPDPARSTPAPSPRPSMCWTSILCASTAPTPITARKSRRRAAAAGAVLKP